MDYQDYKNVINYLYFRATEEQLQLKIQIQYHLAIYNKKINSNDYEVQFTLKTRRGTQFLTLVSNEK